MDLYTVGLPLKHGACRNPYETVCHDEIISVVQSSEPIRAITLSAADQGTELALDRPSRNARSPRTAEQHAVNTHIKPVYLLERPTRSPIAPSKISIEPPKTGIRRNWRARVGSNMIPNDQGLAGSKCNRYSAPQRVQLKLSAELRREAFVRRGRQVAHNRPMPLIKRTVPQNPIAVPYYGIGWRPLNEMEAILRLPFFASIWREIGDEEVKSLGPESRSQRWIMAVQFANKGPTVRNHGRYRPASVSPPMRPI